MVVDNETGGLDYVWDWQKNGEWLFAKVPYCVVWSIMDGQLNLAEIKVVLYICRESLGYKTNKEVTKKLELTSFQKYTGIAKSHLSTAIKSLLDKGIILRSHDLGGGRKYGINFKPFGIESPNSQILK